MRDTDLRVDLVLEYPFSRSTGKVIGAFLTGLREGVLLGIRRPDGTVMVPPVEYDPVTGEQLSELLEVGHSGEIISWTWVDPPRPQSPWDKPHGLALIKLDGADTAMLHAVFAGSPEELFTGMRVTALWRDKREGHITDILGFISEVRS